MATFMPISRGAWTRLRLLSADAAHKISADVERARRLFALGYRTVRHDRSSKNALRRLG